MKTKRLISLDSKMEFNILHNRTDSKNFNFDHERYNPIFKSLYTRTRLPLW